MTLAPKGASIRGDDYQHALGWLRACEMLNDPEIVSVSLEDRAGGSFDDVVTRRSSGPDTYEQAKSSVHGDVVIDTAWLTTRLTESGKSPLEHYFATWRRLTLDEKAFELAFVTNRGYDPADELLGKARDLKTERIHVATVAAATAGSRLGRARQEWQQHLGIEVSELIAFLSQVTWGTGGSETSIDRQAKKEMRLAGLRSDDDAVTIGRALVRSWVTDGVGPQTRADAQRQVAVNNLLSRSGTLLFAIHAIDRQPTSTVANVEVDLLDLYGGADSFTRVQLRNSGDWVEVVQPRLAAAVRALEGYATRRVHVTGSMRLPMWFAVGRALPDVRGWVLSLDQRTEEWRTDATVEVPGTPRALSENHLGQGDDLALVLALTHDPTTEVTSYVRAVNLPVGKVLVLGPYGPVGKDAAPSAGWTATWSRGVRDLARNAVSAGAAKQVHLFIAAPAAAAMMTGHQWNLMPPTVIYEHLRPGYAPTLQLA